MKLKQAFNNTCAQMARDWNHNKFDFIYSTFMVIVIGAFVLFCLGFSLFALGVLIYLSFPGSLLFLLLALTVAGIVGLCVHHGQKLDL